MWISTGVVLFVHVFYIVMLNNSLENLKLCLPEIKVFAWIFDSICELVNIFLDVFLVN